MLLNHSGILFSSQRQVDQNQDLLMKIRRLEEKEEKTLQALSEQLENNKSLKRNIEELQKQARDKDGKLSETNQVRARTAVEIISYFYYWLFS